MIPAGLATTKPETRPVNTTEAKEKPYKPIRKRTVAGFAIAGLLSAGASFLPDGGSSDKPVIPDAVVIHVLPEHATPPADGELHIIVLPASQEPTTTTTAEV